MRSDDWHLTDGVEGFLDRAGDFLYSNPVLHTVALTVTESLRKPGAGGSGADSPVFGWLEQAGEVRAAFFHTPPRHLNLTPLAPEHADALAARLAELGRPVPSVHAEHDTATAFADAWQRRTGATPDLHERQRLYRLRTLTPPETRPEGRGRLAGEQDRERIALWFHEFAAAIGETHFSRAGTPTPPEARRADRRVTFWETPDGTPVSMAGLTPMVAGQIRVGPVYTPEHHRGRGYAGAVTVEASRAALAEGASEVVLFADTANPTSTALYQRLGFVPVADFSVYAFS